MQTDARYASGVLLVNTKGGERVLGDGLPEGRLAPQVGFEPTTLRLTAGCSAIELLRNRPQEAANDDYTPTATAAVNGARAA